RLILATCSTRDPFFLLYHTSPTQLYTLSLHDALPIYYIQARILIMQQGYIRPVEKMNVAIGNTKFPDFALVTHDNYLDILEIKKDRKSTRLNSSHEWISYAVFCLKKKTLK